MNRKRILSFIMVMVMVFAMAATACGKKEEAAVKEEPKQEEASDVDEEDVADVEDDADAADEEADTSKVKKTGDDILTEEDIQSLKDSIRDAVISEYIEPNEISLEEFTWPVASSNDWIYFDGLIKRFTIELYTGVEMDNSDSSDVPDEPNKSIIEAAFKGVLNWLNTQGSYDSEYVGNVAGVLNYGESIPEIDITSK